MKCFLDQIYRLSDKLQRKWEGLKVEQEDKMTVVDFLLNEREWYTANIILSELWSLLKIEEEDKVDPGDLLDVIV